MSASDLFNFSTPFISALGPAILVTAVIANGGELIKLIYKAVNRRGY